VYILSNEKMVKSRAQYSSYLMIGGFALIGISFFLTFFNPTQSMYVLPAYLALFAGFIVFNIGAGYGSKWRMRPRPDEALAMALKGMDNRYRLYNYLLPASHLLLTPAGLTVFAVRRMPGVISTKGSNWYQKRSMLSRLRFAAEEQLGNPTRDVLRDAAAIQEFLAKNLPDTTVAIDPIILFPNPSVKLTIEEPAVPVLTGEALKPYLRQYVTQGARLSSKQYNDLADLFDASKDAEEVDMPSEPESPSAAKQRKSK
jgi:hypothetical protein